MTAYVGLDLGGYKVTIAIAASQFAAINQYDEFTPWVHSEDGIAYVGDTAVSQGAMQQNPDGVYHNFLNQIEQETSLGNLAGLKISGLDLVKIVMQKAALMRPNMMLPDHEPVAAVPSYLNQDQKIALVIAAQRAGLKLSAVIGQGIAKAIVLQNKHDLQVGHIFAIYEWGATQFEFSIFKVLDNKSLEVLASTSLAQIGGYQCDLKLWQLLAEKYKQKRGKELTQVIYGVLNTQLIGTKEGLITRADRSVEIRDFTLDVSQREFESQVYDLISQTIDCAKRAIRIANLSANEIKDIYLTGGSSQISIVMSTLVNEKLSLRVTQEHHSNLASQGAAMFAQHFLTQSNPRIIKESAPSDGVMIVNRSLYYYGLVTSIYDFASKSDKDQNSVVIEMNQPLPIQKQVIFHTDEPWQKMIAFQITDAKAPTTNLQYVNKQEPTLVEFSQGSDKLVEIHINLRLADDHTLHCELENQHTGESHMIKYPNLGLQRINAFNDTVIAVR